MTFNSLPIQTKVYDIDGITCIQRDDVTALLADTSLDYSNTTAGAIIRTRAEGFAYEVAASGATDQHVTTAGGVKLYVQQDASGYNAKAFGAIGDGTTNDQAALQTFLSFLAANGVRGRVPTGTYALASGLNLSATGSGFSLEGDGPTRTVFRRTVNSSYAVIRIDTIDNVTISGIGFDANGVALTSNTHVFTAFDCSKMTIRDCEFKNAPAATCLLIYKSALSSVTDILVENTNFDTGANGGLIEGARASGFRGCGAKNITGSPGFGIQLKNDNGRCFMDNCQAQDCKIAFGCGQDTAGSPDVETSRFSGLQCVDCDWGFIGGDISECVGSNMNFGLNAGGVGLELQGASRRSFFTGVNIRDGEYAVRIRDTAAANVVRLAFCSNQTGYVGSFEDTSAENRVIYEPSIYVGTAGLTAMFRNLGSVSNVFIWKVSGSAVFSASSTETVTHNLKYTIPVDHLALFRSTAGIMPSASSIATNSFNIDFGASTSTTVRWRVVE